MTRVLTLYAVAVLVIALLAGLVSLWFLLGLPVALLGAVWRMNWEPEPRASARVIEEERW
jgi:hypothetical protein